ncbi:MAG: N-acetylmuramoyl-L-alanine amidase [Pseudomonadota bacterium]
MQMRIEGDRWRHGRTVRALRELWGALILIIAAMLTAGPAFAATLVDVDVDDAPGRLTVTVRFDGPFAPPDRFALANPDRLVLDLPGISSIGRTLPGAGAVRQVRTAQFDGDTARLVMDLNAPLAIVGADMGRTVLVLNLAPTTDFAATVGRGRQKLPGPFTGPVTGPVTGSVTEVEPASPSAAQAPAAPRAPPALRPWPRTPTPAPQEASPETADASAALSPRKRRPSPRPRAGGLPVVVVDAGHGGRDPGSPSVDGKREKDATLAIARAIKRELDASGRVRTILTRDDDRYIPHRGRTDIARENNAELFISVHADSFPAKPEVSGATIYTLSETASDKEAARLASRENRAGAINGVDLQSENDDVTSILIDLAQRETMNSSAEFAALLQREMVAAGVPFRSHFHRFAGFLVLKAPDVPAVLLETGYMSNAKDSRYLFSKKGQSEIAKGVRAAVEAHFLRKLAQR